MKYTKQEKIDAQTDLRANYLKPGDTIYLTLASVSSSGMSRIIKVFTADHMNISYAVAAAIDFGFKDGMTGGVRVTGCGMDMGLHLADCLSYALFNTPCEQSHSPSAPAKGLRFKWM